MQFIKTILHPTDFSDCSRCAFDLACSLASALGARLVVAHVIDVEEGQHSFGGVMVEVRPSRYQEQQLQTLKRLVPPYPDVPVEHVLTEGRPTEAILQLAKDARADLIVIGTHGLTGLRRLLLGSVAEQLVRQAPCPVLTTKPFAQAAAPAEGDAPKEPVQSP